MNIGTFSPEQKEHAIAVLTDLMKSQRFFLYRKEKARWEKRLDDSPLDRENFSEVWKLEAALQITYATARAQAEQYIFATETELGVTPATLEQGKQLVQCNRYNGGLKIWDALPFTALSAFAPESVDSLESEFVTRYLGSRKQKALKSAELRALHGRSRSSALRVWEDMRYLRDYDRNNVRTLVLLRTCLNLEADGARRDIMNGQVESIIRHPWGLGYLFFKYSQQQRVVSEASVLFNTAANGHVRLFHSAEGEPGINYEMTGGYHFPVFFATVL